MGTLLKCLENKICENVNFFFLNKILPKKGKRKVLIVVMAIVRKAVASHFRRHQLQQFRMNFSPNWRQIVKFK